MKGECVHSRDNKKFVTRVKGAAFRVSFLVSLFQSGYICAQPNDSPDKLTLTHLDVGENYGIYTSIDGLVIDPRFNPYVLAHYENGNFVADTQTGIGYKFINYAFFNAGLSIVYQYGRHESAESRYRGLGDVSASAAPSVFAEVTAFSGALDVFIETGQSIGATRSRYESIDTMIGLPLTASVNGIIDLLLVGGDAHYTRAFYGVSSAQSITSGYAVYQTSAGLTTMTPSLGLSYDYSKNWELVADVGVIHYANPAANSPLITHRNLPMGNVWLSYKF